MDCDKPQKTIKNELGLEHPSQLLAAPKDSTKHVCGALLSSLMFPKAGTQKRSNNLCAGVGWGELLFQPRFPARPFLPLFPRDQAGDCFLPPAKLDQGADGFTVLQ